MAVKTFDEILKDREDSALMWSRTRLVDLYTKAQTRIEKLEAELDEVYAVEQEIFDMRDSESLTIEDVNQLSAAYDAIARPKIHASNGQYIIEGSTTLESWRNGDTVIDGSKIVSGTIHASQIKVNSF